jgi:hypothetical protein
MANKIDQLLKQRCKTHGDFGEHARITQQLKAIVYSTDNWADDRLSYEQREAIDMILHKLGRILAGDPNVEDHWADLQGYAQLAVESSF